MAVMIVLVTGSTAPGESGWNPSDCGCAVEALYSQEGGAQGLKCCSSGMRICQAGAWSLCRCCDASMLLNGALLWRYQELNTWNMISRYDYPVAFTDDLMINVRL